MHRIRSLDLARGFTVLFIPAIHTGMLYSETSVRASLLGYFLIAIAEGPGGQMLMLLMGLSFTLKREHSTTSVLLKSAGLLIAGYLLNLLKFVLPYSLGVLPDEVLGELDITGEKVVWRLGGMGDILHFAALALPVLRWIYKRKRYMIWALTGAISTAVISPLLWDIHSLQGVPDYVFGLFTGQPPHVFFPVFPWLVYPLTGVFIGYYFQRHQRDTVLLCGIIGALLLVVGLLGSCYYPTTNPAGFYRTPLSETCWHLGIVLLTLCVWHWISTYSSDNRFFQLLAYSSKNITVIYIIQWVIICWMLPVFGFRKLNTLQSALVMVLMTLATYLMTYGFQFIKRRYANK